MVERLDQAEADALAAELALRLLDGDDLVRAQALRQADPSFAQQIEAWEHRLAGLLETVASVEPPSRVWSSLLRKAIGAGQQNEVGRLQRSVRTWRILTSVAAGLAAVLALALVWPRSSVTPPAFLTARLSASPAGSAVFVALYDPSRHAIVLTPATLHAELGKTPELWLVPPGAKPIAVGLADFSGSVQLRPAAGVPSLQGGALAVSLEPKGGSPTGQPTGPIIATGAFTRL